MKKLLLVLLILIFPISASSISLQDAMKRDFELLETWARAHIHTVTAISVTISATNTWQKLDLSTGTPSVQMQGGFTWDAVNKYIVWDVGDAHSFDLTCGFIGAAQIKITSVVSSAFDLELGLVVNGDTTPPVVITPITFTSQSKLNSFGATHQFAEYTNGSPTDTRLEAGDYLEIWVRCVTQTPTFSINGIAVTFSGR